MSGARTPLFTPERWRDVRALVDRLDALPAEARNTELDHIAASDAELAQAARALCMDASASDAAWLRLGGGDVADPTPEAIPAQIGPFRPLRQIGAGGMGVVYLAERRSTDFTQRVALKLLDSGMSSVSRLAARERSILAALVHPNITAFVDAGTQNGRAWLAMEHVDGETLLAYAERLRLDARERVRLFDQICAAVAHAHAQLVVHRDLKPSNVLVNNDGVVKLLDFGIALVLDASAADTPATRVFTPEYASPEQLRGERVTTATDIYALGLMLYELVCGRRLPTIEHSGEWTAPELARFATSPVPGDAQHADAKPAAQLLRGDLGRIIVCALAAQPGQRYATVAQLREELQRWLEHRPLGIARPRFSYLAARFVRRHRAAVAVAALALVALIGASGLALWQAQEARRMAARAEHAKTFLAALFIDVNPFESKLSGKTTVDLLRDASRRIDVEFADAPEVQADLTDVIAEALMRLGAPKAAHELVQRSIDQLKQINGARAPQVGAALALLGMTDEFGSNIEAARREFAQAYELLRDAGDKYRADRIVAMTGLAKMANRNSDYTDAQRWHETVLRERQIQEGRESANLAMDWMNLASDAVYQEHFAQAETLAQRAHAMLEHALGRGHARSIYVDNILGLAQLHAGRIDAAVTTLTQTTQLARRVLPDGTEMIGVLLNNLGKAQLEAGNGEAALASLNEACAILTPLKSPTLGIAELHLGLAQLLSGRSEALRTLRDSRAEFAAVSSQSPGSATNAAWAQAAYGAALAANGEVAEGEREARAARATLLAGKDAGSVALAEIDQLLAGVLDRKSAAGEARMLRDEALTVYRRVYGAEHPRTRTLEQELGVIAAAH